jgi:hypothetical protein
VRRANATLVVVLAASACGGKVVLDATGPGSSSSSSSSGTGGASVSSSIFSASVGSTGGFTSSVGFVASSSAVNDAVATSTGDVNPGCGSFQINGDPMCESCADASCCGELQACDVGTPCAGLLGCLSTCKPGDAACGTKCEEQVQAGLQAAQALEKCYQTSCAQNAACAPATQICTTGASSGNVLCDVCLGADCCAQITACLADMTCLSCLQGSMSPACSQNVLLSQLTMCAQNCANCN